ncbi:MAG TPA: class I SAM-dependent methyltransferase [Ilumatobacteraceae bacterium]|nr:class I SAM-dependent methyltransferase [Ilumatobacteraceae bacterium]
MDPMESSEFEPTADSWAEYAPGWDDDPGARAYSSAAYGSLIEVLATRDYSVAGMSVIDFGCGTGLLAEQLVDEVESIDAVDASPAMLEVLDAKIAARQWTNVHIGRDLPTGSGTHDLVVCSSVCGFLGDYPGTVTRLAELLRPGGLFVQWDWEREDADGDGDGLSRQEITDALTAAGFDGIHVDTAFELPFEGEVMRPLIGIGARPFS